jgi:hypothetical protein
MNPAWRTRTLLAQAVAREAGGPEQEQQRAMSLLDTLIGIFSDNDTHQAFQNDPDGFLNQNGFGNVTSQDIEAEMPRVLEALQGNSGGATQGGAANFAGSGNVVLPPPPGGGGGGGGEEGGLSGAIESINHYTNVLNVTEQSFQDNDYTSIDDRDTTVDQSVNQNITAFGDVNQDFDNDVVSGDGAVAAGDGSQVNTGDGAVQAGDDIEDSTIATGDVGGSVFGDVSDSVVGDGNQVIDDSIVGAASFGEGDATNVVAENANLGDGTIVDDTFGEVALNQGDGDLTQIEDSLLNESVVGDGSVESNDIDISASEGSSVAFGDGASSSAETQTTAIGENSGTIQVADDATQTGLTDNSINDSYDVEDSFNTDLDYTDNSVNDSFDIEDSFDPDQSTTTQDNDGIDVL